MSQTGNELRNLMIQQAIRQSCAVLVDAINLGAASPIQAGVKDKEGREWELAFTHVNEKVPSGTKMFVDYVKYVDGEIDAGRMPKKISEWMGEDYKYQNYPDEHFKKMLKKNKESGTQQY